MNDRDDRWSVDMKLPLVGLAGSGIACALTAGFLILEATQRLGAKPTATGAGLFAIAAVLAFGFLGLLPKQK